MDTARGVISSSRRGAYLRISSEHKEPSPVFPYIENVFRQEMRTEVGRKRTKKKKSKRKGAGKMIPRALVVGFNWVSHRGTRNRPLSHCLSICNRAYIPILFNPSNIDDAKSRRYIFPCIVFLLAFLGQHM